MTELETLTTGLPSFCTDSWPVLTYGGADADKKLKFEGAGGGNWNDPGGGSSGAQFKTTLEGRVVLADTGGNCTLSLDFGVDKSGGERSGISSY